MHTKTFRTKRDRPQRNAEPTPRSPRPWAASGCASPDRSPPAPTVAANPTAPATPTRHTCTAPTSNGPATSTARRSTPTSSSSSSPTTSSCATTPDAYASCSNSSKRSPSKQYTPTATLSVDPHRLNYSQRSQSRLCRSHTRPKPPHRQSHHRETIGKQDIKPQSLGASTPPGAARGRPVASTPGAHVPGRGSVAGHTISVG